MVFAVWDNVEPKLSPTETERKHFSMNQLIQRLKQTPAYESNPPRISLSSATLSILIDVLALDFDDFGHEHYVGLPQRLHTWREQRNTITHKIVYTKPTNKSYDRDFYEFLSSAEDCAWAGKDLVRHTTNWDRMYRRRTEKKERELAG